MQYELNQQELNIIQKALKDLLEVGITEPQENYIRNIDSGMSEDESGKIYSKENKKFWKKMIEVEKNQLYILYARLFGPLY
jgi:predicted transcriptional regulator